MTIKRITTIVPVQILKPLERHLRSCGIPGVTACALKAGTQAGILAVEAIERLVHLPSGVDVSTPLSS